MHVCYPHPYLTGAFAQLDSPDVDVTLGPCEDGGYYLIGWKQSHPRLVREVEMSTSHVLQDTIAIAQEEKLRVALLPSWYDVDELPELRRLQKELQANPSIAPHTSAFFESGG